MYYITGYLVINYKKKSWLQQKGPQRRPQKGTLYIKYKIIDALRDLTFFFQNRECLSNPNTSIESNYIHMYNVQSTCTRSPLSSAIAKLVSRSILGYQLYFHV